MSSTTNTGYSSDSSWNGVCPCKCVSNSNLTSDSILYCLACGGPDEGSRMIGCDNEENCDNWYHYPCVNITETPADDEKWFCPECTKSKKSKKKKKRY